jgi:PPP family 3-phenylpropionic acid transporter
LFNNAILGVCLSLVLPYIEIITLNHLGGDKYGKSRLFGSIGFILIALVLGKFLTSSDIALHYYLGATTLTAIFALLLIKYDECELGANGENQSFDILKHLPFWISLFLMQVSFGGFYNFFTIYETENGLSLETVSYLWAFGVLCEVLMFVFQAPLLKRNLLNLIKIAIFITIIRWLLLYLFPNSLMVSYLSQSLHAFGFSMYYTACVLYLFSIYQNKKLAQQFMLGLSYGLGAFVGAIVAGQVYGQYLFLVFAGIALLALISIFKLKIVTNPVFIPLKGKK